MEALQGAQARVSMEEDTLPYRILVSEIMLQQTQADRVVAYYSGFFKRSQRVSLARSSVKDVLLAWQGLGYNRRALYLKQAAEIIIKKFHGDFQNEQSDIETFPA